jgi:hypothetical protein
MINKTISRFATHDNSAYPQLWRGCVGAWCPSLGPSGSRLHDYSRRMAWGTLTNMDVATDWVTSGGAYALDFDGTNDNVTTLSTFGPGAGPMSVSYWYDGRSVSQFNMHFTQRPASFNSAVHSTWGIGQGNYLVAPANTLRIGVLLYTPSGYRIWLSDNNYADIMRHYAFTEDGSSIKVYIDGVEVSGTTTPSGGWPNIPSTSAIAIGGSQDGTLATNGLIDDVRVYDRVLSQTEIRLLARRRGIAFTPRARRLAVPEQSAAGATPWRYARQRSRIIGGGIS